MKHSTAGRVAEGTLSVFLNLRIRTRLMLAFAGVFALMLALAAFATVHMARLHAEMGHITQNNNQQVAEVNKMIYAVTQQGVALRNLALLKDAEQKKTEIEAIAKHRQDYQASHQRLLKLIAEFDASEAEKALLEAIERAGTTTLPLVDQAIQLAQGDDSAAAVSFLMDRVRPRQQRWVVVLQTMSGLQDKTSREFVQDSNDEFARTRAWMIGMVTAGLLSGIVLAWGVTKSITQPLGEAVRAANTIADGDLTRRVESTRRDELGELLRAMDGMVAALAAVVREVRSGSESIALGTGEIATGNADLSHRTERQAASLQRTSQSMADIRLTARDNAEAATQAQSVAGEASRAAAAGGEVVAQVVQTMDGIAGASKRVVDIIGVIDSLAFQTNILALNAAVEAARAGEQGRGFAVVASEVRALAKRSGEAAREIRSLIHASVEQVESGSRLVQGAGSTMGEIVTQVTRVNALIEAISRSATDETAGIDSIGDAVGDIDTVTQQNAALVEQSAAAAESLRQQAQRLLDAVGRFKLAAA